MAKQKGYKNLSPDGDFGKGHFFSAKELREINEFRESHGVRELRQENVTCLMCDRVFRSPDAVNRRICADCHADPDYTSAAAGVGVADALDLFADIDGKLLMTINPGKENGWEWSETGLHFR